MTHWLNTFKTPIWHPSSILKISFKNLKLTFLISSYTVNKPSSAPQSYSIHFEGQNKSVLYSWYCSQNIIKILRRPDRAASAVCMLNTYYLLLGQSVYINNKHVILSMRCVGIFGNENSNMLITFKSRFTSLCLKSIGNLQSRDNLLRRITCRVANR